MDEQDVLKMQQRKDFVTAGIYSRGGLCYDEYRVAKVQITPQKEVWEICRKAEEQTRGWEALRLDGSCYLWLSRQWPPSLLMYYIIL